MRIELTPTEVDCDMNHHARAYKGFFLGGVQNFRGGGYSYFGGGIWRARSARDFFTPPPKNLYPGVQIFWGGYFTKKYLHFNKLQKQSLKVTIYANQIIYA